jgi:hypothetical protein
MSSILGDIPFDKDETGPRKTHAYLRCYPSRRWP